MKKKSRTTALDSLLEGLSNQEGEKLKAKPAGMAEISITEIKKPKALGMDRETKEEDHEAAMSDPEEPDHGDIEEIVAGAPPVHGADDCEGDDLEKMSADDLRALIRAHVENKG
jgi:hypothetical protein